jgi:hypothetical protein
MGQTGATSTNSSLFLHPSPPAKGGREVIPGTRRARSCELPPSHGKNRRVWSPVTRRAYVAVSHQARSTWVEPIQAHQPIRRLSSLGSTELAEVRQSTPIRSAAGLAERVGRVERSEAHQPAETRQRPNRPCPYLSIFDVFFGLATFSREERPDQPIHLIATDQDVAFHGFLWFFWPTGFTTGSRSRSILPAAGGTRENRHKNQVYKAVALSNPPVQCSFSSPRHAVKNI